MWKKTYFIGLSVVFILSMVLTACGGNGEKGSSSSNGSEGNKNSENTMKLGEKQITLLGNHYQSHTASLYVAKQVLEKVGYDVKIKQVGGGALFAGIANGSADATLGVWLPTTDASYWKRFKDKLNKIGIVINEAPLGLTVPTYMKDINSIEDLAKNKNGMGEKLNWTITGISPGVGEMEVTKNKVMSAYGMKDKWKLQASSASGMLSTLSKAIEEKKPVVITLWYPHWAFIRWDLKLLKDPKNKYGDPDNIYAVAREGFKKDSPVAY
ncbi:MAG TPA: glycine betaine ABC transporter substrate-binding protein, partial [Bacillales bacterium]|nr:glycine betaine ABC transporter substrate-binding protein [Bacillales bacterium]